MVKKQWLEYLRFIMDSHCQHDDMQCEMYDVCHQNSWQCDSMKALQKAIKYIDETYSGN